jgi:tetratricopeptide (TPR) repeat protein
MSSTQTSRGWPYRRLKWQAMALLLIGRKAEAEDTFGAILQSWPFDAYALASRSHLRATTGRRGPAIEDARALTQAHPSRSAADWFNLAFLLEAADELDEAETAFRRALVLDDKLDRAWYGLALTLIRTGRLEDAVPALKRSTELQPMSPYGWYQLARVHANSHRPEEAVKIIRHLKGFEPKVAAQLERETGLAVS